MQPERAETSSRAVAISGICTKRKGGNRSTHSAASMHFGRMPVHFGFETWIQLDSFGVGLLGIAGVIEAVLLREADVEPGNAFEPVGNVGHLENPAISGGCFTELSGSPLRIAAHHRDLSLRPIDAA